MLRTLSIVLMLCALLAGLAHAQDDPLPSWNSGHAKTKILSFVEAVTKEGGKDFVKPDDRVAVFDNDGTLWVEQPVYTQVLFSLDRVRAMAPGHPSWATTQPFKAVLQGDMKTLLSLGVQGLGTIVVATHANLTPEQYRGLVAKWLQTAVHPRFKVPFTQLVYQPQLELMSYLRAHGFKVYIVTGGGMSFVRVFADKVYGVPRENVVGSSLASVFRKSDYQVVSSPTVNFIDDGPGKPVGIETHIGRRPIFAFGNSDGDLQMLQFTTAGKHRSLGLLLHHDDATREYAYDVNSKIGTLNRAWQDASKHHWVVVSMKSDFKTVFPAQH